MVSTLQVIGFVLSLAIVLKLCFSGLHTRYRWLLVYLIFNFARIAWPRLARMYSDEWGPASYNYSIWWAATEPIHWVLMIVLVLDLCGAIFHQFPALATFGGRIYKGALAAAITFSLASLFLSGLPEENVYIHILLTIQRVVLTSLLLVILALLFSLTWFRVTVNRNTLVHATVFFTYFFAKAGIVFLLQTVGFEVREGVNTALAALNDICYLAWLIGLQPEGEHSIMQVGHRWNPEEGERLVQQLAKLNDSLANRGSSGRGVRSIPSEQ